MTPDSDPRSSAQKTEQLIHRTLRALPPRRAPRSLEQRVMAELSRRAALPWWRKSFASWPAPALAVFILASLGVIKLLLTGALWAAAGFDGTELQAAMAQPLLWWESGQAVAGAISHTVEIMLRNIPPLWLYGALAVITAVYATLFGLGAAAFKALRPHS